MSAVTNLENKSYACVLVDFRTSNPYHNRLLEMLTWFPKVSYWGGGRGRLSFYSFLIFAIYARTLLTYTAASPDPNPRGGGQLPNPKSAILR